MNSLLKLFGYLKTDHVVANLKQAVDNLKHVAEQHGKKAVYAQASANAAKDESERANRILSRIEALIE